MTELGFLRTLANLELRTIDRVLAMLWWIGVDGPAASRTTTELCVGLEASGHPKQNASRLRKALRAHRGVATLGQDSWRLHPNARRELDVTYAHARSPMPLLDSDSVLPLVLFRKTRGYIERVVEQINKSYDARLFDCCAVMCRRLVETLIIEVYEARSQATDIKGSDGHFLMLSGLVSFLENDPAVHLSRSTTQGLKDFKKLGDLCAHSRRFNAERPDIDRVRDGLRVGAQELLHLAGLK